MDIPSWRRFRFSRAGRLALLPLLAAMPLAANGIIIYNSIPDPLPPSSASVGYEANGIAELGELIQLGGGSTYTLLTATVLMTDWALQSDFNSPGAGFDQAITLNFYTVDSSSGMPLPAGPFASFTQEFFIPFQPAHDPTCANSHAWRDAAGTCINGTNTLITFDLNQLQVPAQLIYTVAFNTQHYGADPTGQAGPYNSLNLGVSTGAPATGSNPLPDTAYWSGTSGELSQSTGWTPYNVGAEFTAAPEPLSGLLLGTGGLAVLLGRMRHRLPMAGARRRAGIRG